MTKIQAVVFDLYDTLIYFANKTKPYAKLFSDLELTPEEMKLGRKIALTENFQDLVGLATRLKPDHHLDLANYEMEIKNEAASSTLYSESKNVLEKLRNRNLKRGLISNLASPYKKPFFELELNEYFNEIIFSCDVGLRKPDPRIYKLMIQRLGIDPSAALMTGDKLHADVSGPKSIGMNAILLDRNNASHNSLTTLERIFQYL